MMNFTYSASYRVQIRNLSLIANLLPCTFSQAIEPENVFSSQYPHIPNLEKVDKGKHFFQTAHKPSSKF